MNTYSFDERKEQLINKVTAALLDAYEKEEIDDEISRKIAQYILLVKDALVDDAGLIDFVKDLGNTFDFFKGVAILQEQSVAFSAEDQEKLSDVKKQLEMLGSTHATNPTIN